MLSVDRQTILEAVHKLSADEQWEIAQEILRAVPRREPPPVPSRRRGAAASLRGIAKTEIPLDDTRLLEETRTKRYG